MPDKDHPLQQPAEFDRWLRRDRALPWRRIVAAALVVALIVCLDTYLLSPGVRRRADYVLLRAQARLKKPQPHERYVPTPVLPTPTVQAEGVRDMLPPTPTPTASPMPTPRPTPTQDATPLPASVLLDVDGHEPQGWNNCGPATLSMALRFYGWTRDQYAIAEAVKPDKNDKNVTPQEMAAYVGSLDELFAAVGYAANTRVLKLLLSNNFLVIVETWFVPEPGDEMGHYRLLTGYDDAAQQFMTQDAYQGRDRSLAYAELETLWKVFNRAFIVVCETSRSQDLTALLGDSAAFPAMHRNALAVALAEASEHPDDRYAWFNVGTNYVGLGQYEAAAQAYDRARTLKLPYRMLWYQFGPFEAYFRIGRYQDVIDLANASLRSAENLEESYYYRALARRALGDEAAARQDLETALRYNPAYAAAAKALAR